MNLYVSISLKAQILVKKGCGGSTRSTFPLKWFIRLNCNAFP